MFIIAFLLGLWFGALSKIGCCWAHARLVEADSQQAARVKAGARIASFGAAALTLILVIAACLHAVGDYYNGQVPDQVDSFIGFLAVPTNIGVLLAFIAGALAVWFWRHIKKFMQDFHLMRRDSSSDSAGTTEAKAAVAVVEAAGAAADAEANKEPYPWLTRIVGIAAVTLVAVLALLAFYPSLLINLRHIKVAGVEVQLATSAQQTVRVSTQLSKGKFVTNYTLDAWVGLDNVIDNYSIYAQDAVLRQQSSAGLSAPLNPALPQFAALNRARNFLDRYAVPMADALACYSRDFEISKSHFHVRLADLANSWARFAYLVNNQTRKIGRGALPEQPTATKLKNQFSDLEKKTDGVFLDLYSDLLARKSACGVISIDNEVYTFGRTLDDSHQDEFVQHLSEIFANGYVLAFIGDLMLLTHEPERVVAFLEAMEPYIDQSTEGITGQINYYYRLANVRFQDDYWTSTAANRELKIAQRRVETINKAFAAGALPCPPPDRLKAGDRGRVRSYYCGMRVLIIGLQAVNLVRDWLEARTLSPSDIFELENWDKEMLAWATHASVPHIIESKTGRPQWIGNIYDTIALDELVTAASSNKLTKEKCIRISHLLTQSRNAWTDLRDEYAHIAGRLIDEEQKTRFLKRFDRETYLAAMQTYEAHRNLFLGTCRQQS